MSAADAVAATERRLARIGFDLHDGPLQVALALLSDLRLFSSQLESQVQGIEGVEILQGRVEDFVARAHALQMEIRELARGAAAPATLAESVEDVLRSEAQALADATGTNVEVETSGDLDNSTASQRIALLRGVQEALRNTREHSGARKVRVTAKAYPERLEVEVRDDGGGFDVDRTIAQAAEEGRLGLRGIVERARLLGGDCEVHSRPGETAVRITLPRWDPDDERVSPGA